MNSWRYKYAFLFLLGLLLTGTVSASPDCKEMSCCCAPTVATPAPKAPALELSEPCLAAASSEASCECNLNPEEPFTSTSQATIGQTHRFEIEKLEFVWTVLKAPPVGAPEPLVWERSEERLPPHQHLSQPAFPNPPPAAA